MGNKDHAGAPQILLDHQSPHGPKVTHLRGLLMMDALENLRGWGVYETYLERITPEYRSLLQSTLATSWVPVEHAVTHYSVAQTLGITDESVTEASERMAARVAELYLAAPLKAARRNEGDAIHIFAGVLAHNDKIWDRMYQGGATRAVQLGPRELSLEDRGIPLARFAIFRMAYEHYLDSMVKLFAPGGQAHLVPTGDPDTLATRFSWTSAP
jgi:hypothetical protein